MNCVDAKGVPWREWTLGARYRAIRSFFFIMALTMVIGATGGSGRRSEPNPRDASASAGAMLGRGFLPADGHAGEGTDSTRELQEVNTCVEYSEVSSYCCGTAAKNDCQVAGGTYSGPDFPCEVVKVDVSTGPVMCTGLANASGLLLQCPCNGEPGITPAPTKITSGPIAITLAPSTAPTVASTMSQVTLSPATPAPTTAYRGMESQTSEDTPVPTVSSVDVDTTGSPAAGDVGTATGLSAGHRILSPPLWVILLGSNAVGTCAAVMCTILVGGLL